MAHYGLSTARINENIRQVKSKIQSLLTRQLNGIVQPLSTRWGEVGVGEYTFKVEWCQTKPVLLSVLI